MDEAGSQIACRIRFSVVPVRRFVALGRFGRQDLRTTVTNVVIRPGTHRRVHAEKRVESVIERPPDERLRQIEDRPAAVRGNEFKSEMPFPDHPCGITLRLQHFRDGQFLCFQNGTESIDAVNDTAPCRIDPREQTVTRSGTGRTWRMRVRESQSFFRQSVDVRRGNLRLGIVDGAVAVSHVIRVDNDDVGLFFRRHVRRRHSA